MTIFRAIQARFTTAIAVAPFIVAVLLAADFVHAVGPMLGA